MCFEHDWDLTVPTALYKIREFTNACERTRYINIINTIDQEIKIKVLKLKIKYSFSEY